jgi:hypothetical protein
MVLSDKYKLAINNKLTSVSTRCSQVFHEAGIAPNRLQLAIAQCAVGIVSKCKKQMWSVQAGQGKGRIMAAIALILLMEKVTSKVHLVFDNQHLLQRDQQQF